MAEETNPAIEFLRESLEITVATDMIEQARLAGVVVSENVKAQAANLAQVAVRALLRRINVVKMTTTQTNNDIRLYDENAQEHGLDINFETDVAMPEIADELGKLLVREKFLSITKETKSKQTHWTTQAFIVPPNAFELPVPPPPVAPRRTGLILPPSVR